MSTETITVEVVPSTSSAPQSRSSEPPEVFRLSPEPEEILPSRATSPSTSRPSSQATDISDVSRTPVARPSPSIPPRSRQSEVASLEGFQAETMGVLNHINENLTNISENIKTLTDAIVDYVNRN